VPPVLSLAPGSPPPQTQAPLPIDGSRGGFYAQLRWEIPRVRAALDALDAGLFGPAVLLRDYIRRDPRARAAEEQPTSTLLGLKLDLAAGESEHGNSPLEAMRRAGEGLFGDEGRAADGAALKEIAEDVTGFATKWAWLHFEPSADATTWNPILTPWPMSAVRKDEKGRYAALLDGGEEMVIEGPSWIQFSLSRHAPHLRGAVRSIGETWIARQYAVQDAATRSASVREAKYIGELPPGVKMKTKEANQFAADLQGLVRSNAGVVFEQGGKVTISQASSDGHKIFFELEKLCASDFAIAYSGQDGTTATGSTGTYGARQVLYGVAYDLLRGLARVICGGLNEVLRQWAFYNFGRDYYPRARIEVPDLEAEQARALATERRPLMLKELQSLAARGPLPEALVFEVANRYGQTVTPAWAAIWAQPTPAPAAPMREPDGETA
jgi:hypothetical protein